MRKLILMLLLFLPVLAFAADRPADKPVKLENALDIRDAQVSIAQTSDQMAQLRDTYTKLQKLLEEQQKTLQNAVDKAFKDAGVTKEVYDLNIDKRVFTAKPVAPVPTPVNPDKAKGKQ